MNDFRDLILLHDLLVEYSIHTTDRIDHALIMALVSDLSSQVQLAGKKNPYVQCILDRQRHEKNNPTI